VSHEKIILGNRVPVDEDELREQIIDGIPDITLRDQARIQKFSSVDALLEAFEGVALRERGAANPSKRGGSRRDVGDGRVAAVSSKRCFNCGERDHVNANCPTKNLGAKCFACGGRGHIASRCSRRTVSEPKRPVVASVARVTQKKYTKVVLINNRPVTALIDTGSDISIMRASEYIATGPQKLEPSDVEFCGIGGCSATTLGELQTQITIDDNIYSILIRVVPDSILQYSLFIGADFLDKVEMNFKCGTVTVRPACEQAVAGEARPEIFTIDVMRDVNTVDMSHVENIKYKRAITGLIESYKPARTREVDVRMTIILKDDEPIYQKARRLSQAERDIVNDQIGEWEKQGMVRASTSDFASAIVLVKKKDGSHRLCVDYRMLNKKIIRDRYPLPLIEDQFDQLQSAKVFSTLDLKNGFFHVRVDEASIKYTSYIVPDGQYEFLRVPFGLCNSPSVFQRFVNVIFRDLMRQKLVLIYMDDLIVLSENEDDGFKNLELVLEVASRAGLDINWKKCHFLRKRVEFLGHIIENGKIRPSEQKIKAVSCFPEPRSVRQVQAFLGLSGYFRKFIPKYYCEAVDKFTKG